MGAFGLAMLLLLVLPFRRSEGNANLATPLDSQIIAQINQIVNQWLKQQDPFINKYWLVGEHKQAFNLSYIAQTDSLPQTIVVGNSHVEYINSHHLHTSVFNHFIPAGNRLDSLEQILTHYQKRGAKLRRVIVGLDVSILDTNFRYQKDLSVLENGELLQKVAKKEWGNMIASFQKIPQNYFNEPLHVLTPADKPANEDNDHVRLSTFINKDGSLVPCEQRKGCTAMPIVAVKQMMFETHQWFNGTPNLQTIQFFESLMERMQADGIEVTFVLMPIHPVAYDEIRNNPMLNWSFEYFTRFAHKNNIPLLGSFNPEDCKLVAEDFEDDDHVKAQTITKLFKDPYCKSANWNPF